MSIVNRHAPLPRICLDVRPHRRRAGFGAYFALTKPRVMSLTVFTALVGLLLAPHHKDPLKDLVALLCIAIGAGSAAALNMWFDADIDAVMARTARRPIPSGLVSRTQALAFGLMLAAVSVAGMALLVNSAAAATLAFTIYFYVVVYTMWLKRYTTLNIVIGGVAGALPPLIGWVSASDRIDIEPLLLFLIIFFWTPPHFWALSLNRVGEYARAGIPMLPVVAGKTATKRQILIYSIILFPISMLPWALGFAGALYGATAGLLSAAMIFRAWQICRSRNHESRLARRFFSFSILYLFLLFVMLPLDAVAVRQEPPLVAINFVRERTMDNTKLQFPPVSQR